MIMLTGIGIGLGLFIIVFILFKFVLNKDTQDAVLRKFNVMVKKAIKINNWDMVGEAYDRYIFAISKNLPALKNAASVSTDEATQARNALKKAKEMLAKIELRLDTMDADKTPINDPTYIASAEEGMALEREIQSLEERVPELELIAKHLTEDYRALEKQLEDLGKEKVTMIRDMKAQKTQMEMRGLLEKSAANGGTSAKAAIDAARIEFEENKRTMRGELIMRENSPEAVAQKLQAELGNLDAQAWAAARQTKKGETNNG